MVKEKGKFVCVNRTMTFDAPGLWFAKSWVLVIFRAAARCTSVVGPL